MHPTIRLDSSLKRPKLYILSTLNSRAYFGTKVLRTLKTVKKLLKRKLLVLLPFLQSVMPFNNCIILLRRLLLTLKILMFWDLFKLVLWSWRKFKEQKTRFFFSIFFFLRFSLVLSLFFVRASNLNFSFIYICHVFDSKYINHHQYLLSFLKLYATHTMGEN